MKVKRWLSIVLALSMVFAVLGCDDDDSSKKKKANGPKITGKVINLSGGSGTLGGGGEGGEIDIDWYGLGGVVFMKSGTVDTSFNIPTYTNVVNLGDEGWTVGADIAVASLSAGEPAAPAYHMHDDDINLYWGDGGATVADTVVTGIKINQGVTLTMPLNDDAGGSGCRDRLRLQLGDDLVINGTLTVANLTTGTDCVADPESRHGDDALASDSGSMNIDPNRVYIRDRGLVDTRGADAVAADTRGGDGGYVYIYAAHGLFSEGRVLATGGDANGDADGGNGAILEEDNPGVTLESDGGLTNRGSIDASGGDGVDGGHAGYVYVHGDACVWNAGDLLSNGGMGTAAGYGGYAYWVDITSWYASVFNRGLLSSDGGDSGYDAGYGYGLRLYAGWEDDYIGKIISAGNLRTDGGSASVYGGGGDAGDIYINGYGDRVLISGKLLASGGDATGDGYSGGTGGDIYISNYEGSDYYYDDEPRQARNVVIANDVIATGGDGYYGGSGGYLGVDDDYDEDGDTFFDRTLRIIGHDIIRLNGGDGAYGGGGGDFEIYGEDQDMEQYYAAVPGVILNVPIQVNGGDGTNGDGGAGGDMEMWMEGEVYDEHSKIISNSRIEILGGDSLANGNGGDGGYVYWWAFHRVENNGAIIADGGDGAGAGSSGGYGDYIYLLSSNKVINNGTISGNGGDGVLYGGDGGDMHLYAGGFVINNDALRLRGGAGATGGDGGELNTLSQLGRTRNNGTVDVRGGAVDGMDGYIYFDWIDVTPADGTLGF